MTQRHTVNPSVDDDDRKVVREGDLSPSPSLEDWIEAKKKYRLLLETHARVINQAHRESKKDKEFSILAFHKICLFIEYFERGVKTLGESLVRIQNLK